MPFVPTGYLKHSEAIDRVAEIINVRDPVPLLTQEERDTLQGVRDKKERATRFHPREVTPVHSLSTNRLFVPHQVRKFVEAEPPPQPLKISREEFKDLEAKEARIKEQHHVAEQVLRQLLYAGRVSCKTLNKNGLCIETPKYIWGGEQWDEALKRGWVEFPGALGLSVSGRPIILQDALEAVFNPDGTVKEEPRPELKQEVEPQEKPQATPEAQTAQGSEPLSETELDLKDRAQAVLDEGHIIQGLNSSLSTRGLASRMARKAADGKFQGWGEDALCKILDGRYEPVSRLGLKRLHRRVKYANI